MKRPSTLCGQAPYQSSLLLPHLQAPADGGPEKAGRIPTRMVDTSGGSDAQRLAKGLEETLCSNQVEMFEEFARTAPRTTLSRPSIEAIVRFGRAHSSSTERLERCLNLLLTGLPDFARLVIAPFDPSDLFLAPYYSEAGQATSELRAHYRSSAQHRPLPPEHQPDLACYLCFSPARVVDYRAAYEALQMPDGTAHSPGSTAAERPLSEEEAARLLAHAWNSLMPVIPGWTPSDARGQIETFHWYGWSDDSERLDELRYEIGDSEGRLEDGRLAEELSEDELRDIARDYIITIDDVREHLPEALTGADSSALSAPIAWTRPLERRRAECAGGHLPLAERIYRAGLRCQLAGEDVARRYTLPQGPSELWLPPFGLVWCDGKGGLCREMFEEAMQFHAEHEIIPPDVGLLFNLDDTKKGIAALLQFVQAVREALLAAHDLLTLIDPGCTGLEHHAAELEREISTTRRRAEAEQPQGLATASLPRWALDQAETERTAHWLLHAAAKRSHRDAGRFRRKAKKTPKPPPSPLVPLVY